MWPVCLFVSTAVHVTLLVSVGVKSGSQAEAPAQVFSMVALPPLAMAAMPREYVAVRGDGVANAVVDSTKAKREGDKRGVDR